jgi:hypothetical protein
MFSTEVILSSLLYTIDRACNCDMVYLTGEPDQLAQLKQLVLTFDTCCKDWGVDRIMCESLAYYCPRLLVSIRNASNMNQISVD